MWDPKKPIIFLVISTLSNSFNTINLKLYQTLILRAELGGVVMTKLLILSLLKALGIIQWFPAYKGTDGLRGKRGVIAGIVLQATPLCKIILCTVSEPFNFYNKNYLGCRDSI